MNRQLLRWILPSCGWLSGYLSVGVQLQRLNGWLINLRGGKDGEKVNMWQERLVVCFSDLHLHSTAKNKQYCGNAYLPLAGIWTSNSAHGFLKWFVRKENMAVGSLPCEQCSVAECCLYGSVLDYEVCLPDTNTPSLHSLCSPSMCGGVLSATKFCQCKEGKSIYWLCFSRGHYGRPFGGGSCLKNSSRVGGGVTSVANLWKFLSRSVVQCVYAEMFLPAVGIVDRFGVSTVMTLTIAVYWNETL